MVFNCIFWYQYNHAFDGEIIPDATYTIGTGGTCNNTLINGSYIAGELLTVSNYVSIDTNVTYVGSFSINTGTINGYSFSASGIFTSMGTQTVNLMGIGTPVADQIDNFTATANIGGGTCTFSITVQPWQCGIPISDSRDGQFYNTVLIGSQCWLAENMNIGTMISNTVN